MAKSKKLHFLVSLNQGLKLERLSGKAINMIPLISAAQPIMVMITCHSIIHTLCFMMMIIPMSTAVIPDIKVRAGDLSKSFTIFLKSAFPRMASTATER